MHKIGFFFSDKNLNFIGQLFNVNGNIKPWKDLKIKFDLKDTHKIYWLQILDALPNTWKDIILKDKGNAKNLVIVNHHIVRNSQIYILKKLSSKELYLILVQTNSQIYILNINKLTNKELYLILVQANTVKPTAQGYFENLFKTSQ